MSTMGFLYPNTPLSKFNVVPVPWNATNSSWAQIVPSHHNCINQNLEVKPFTTIWTFDTRWHIAFCIWVKDGWNVSSSRKRRALIKCLSPCEHIYIWSPSIVIWRKLIFNLYSREKNVGKSLLINYNYCERMLENMYIWFIGCHFILKP